MTARSEIIERLGETTVLLPSLIGEALAANDRIKLRLTLLQEAAAQAQTPPRDRHRDAGSRACGNRDLAPEARGVLTASPLAGTV